MVSTTPAFNLKVVLKETGIAADTLRAWERRYGLPMPQRSAGGHRLYSQRDIETIKWLIKRQEDGLSISRAVDLWNEQIASGTDPLADLVQAGPAATIPLQYPSPDTTLDSLRAQWIERGMYEIGERWYENRASVQQEHFASALAMRRLDALLSASPAPTRNQTVLIGCPPEEWHTFTPLLLALLLRRRGLNVVYLGANVPEEQFTMTVKEIRANLVVLVAQQLITAATLQQTALALSGQEFSVTFGGHIFNRYADLPTRISGYFLGPDLPSALDQIEVLLNKKLKFPQLRAPSPGYRAAHHAFVSKRGQIELTLREWIEPLSLAPDSIKTGIYFLSENIAAALQLGDLSYVSGEVDWLKVLLQFHEARPEQLIQFMEAYSEAVNRNINGQGKPIFEWFAAEVEKLRTGSS
jgi:DNA-binding transcriptional MerR regulator